MSEIIKPLIFYIDDEPRNLAVFEASMPEEWEIKVFDNPLKAIEVMSKEEPWVIISDQKMPAMCGVEYLEIAKKMCPSAIRIIVTGYSDEDLVVESVRKAKIFDYIRKPWDPDELEAALQKAIEYYQIKKDHEMLFNKLKEQEIQLTTKNNELLQKTNDLLIAKDTEKKAKEELECWVPPFVRWALNNDQVQFPVYKDLVGITFDIINSSKIHDIVIRERPLRSIIIQTFSEILLKYGGWRESHSGDSAYGHFGLSEETDRPFESALSVAREFKSTLRSISEVNSVEVECGISLHLTVNCKVDVHSVVIQTPRGPLKQKSFDTTATDVDLLHRMETISHFLPGSNVIVSESFLKGLKSTCRNLKEIGWCQFKGQSKAVKLYLIASELVNENEFNNFINLLKEKNILLNSSEQELIDKKTA